MDDKTVKFPQVTHWRVVPRKPFQSNILEKERSCELIKKSARRKNNFQTRIRATHLNLNNINVIGGRITNCTKMTLNSCLLAFSFLF